MRRRYAIIRDLYLTANCSPLAIFSGFSSHWHFWVSKIEELVRLPGVWLPQGTHSVSNSYFEDLNKYWRFSWTLWTTLLQTINICIGAKNILIICFQSSWRNKSLPDKFYLFHVSVFWNNVSYSQTKKNYYLTNCLF